MGQAIGCRSGGQKPGDAALHLRTGPAEPLGAEAYQTVDRRTAGLADIKQLQRQRGSRGAVVQQPRPGREFGKSSNAAAPPRPILFGEGSAASAGPVRQARIEPTLPNTAARS